MKTVRGPATLSSAFVVAALGVLSAFAQLNPTVKVLPKPQMAVPPECEQGLAPAAPRVIIAENPVEEPKRAAEPPTLDLKTRLRAVQAAAEQGDHDAFKSALADARAAVASYPPGGERTAANDVLSAYGDLEGLWDYQLTSPTGAFFDSSTDFVGMMRRYPDYAKFVSDQTLNVGGQTVYPTVETRQFLAAEAARRLERLGVRTPARIAEAPTKAAPVPRVQPAAPPSASVPRHVPEKRLARKAAHTTPHGTTTPHIAAAPHVAATPRKAVKKPQPLKVAEARTTAPKPRATPVPSAAPAPAPLAQPKNAEPPPSAVTTKNAGPPPAAGATKNAGLPPAAPAATTAAKESTPAPPPATSSAPASSEPTATTATTPATSSEIQTTTTTGTAASGQSQPQSSGRPNLLFAIILIILGVGVLIILFRASD